MSNINQKYPSRFRKESKKEQGVGKSVLYLLKPAAPRLVNVDEGEKAWSLL